MSITNKNERPKLDSINIKPQDRSVEKPSVSDNNLGMSIVDVAHDSNIGDTINPVLGREGEKPNLRDGKNVPNID